MIESQERFPSDRDNISLDKSSASLLTPHM